MKILVTGANGFVGRALLPSLRAGGHWLRAGVRAPQPIPAADEVVAIGDIARADWDAAVTGMDAVIHLAARAHVIKDRTTAPLTAFRAANVLPVARLAAAAAKAGVKRVVLVSSIKAICDEAAATPLDETAAMRATTPYGRSKWEGEQALIDTLSDYPATDWCILRPPLILGPDARGNIARLRRLITAGIPLPFAGLENRRSVITVDHMAAALVTAATAPSCANRLFHVADAPPLSTAAMIQKIASDLGQSARLIPAPPRLLRQLLRAVPQLRPLHDRLFGDLVVNATAWHALTKEK